MKEIELFVCAFVVFVLLVFAILLLIMVNRSEKVRQIVKKIVFAEEDEKFDVVKVGKEDVLFVDGDIYEDDFTDFSYVSIDVDENGYYRRVVEVGDNTKTLLMRPEQAIPANGRIMFTGYFATADSFIGAR